jgi:TonB-linked SusC/RagA family outer membrane protein
MKTFFSKHLKSVILYILILFNVTSGVAQSVIKGVVKDLESGEPLIGANVFSKEDPSSGTITDFEGNYTFELEANTTTLVFSYAGYGSKEEVINGRTQIDVNLSAGQLLEDVVIIGYGTVKRADATGSVQTVSSSNFNRGAITGPQELLAGKVAGVTISTDGNPGGGSSIRIRGESSISASNDPLIVIDGVPVDNGAVGGNRNVLNIINPNDIETFTVLKDASAAAIYGNRASGGVILITTKKGTLGSKMAVSYSGNVSVGVTRNRLDILNAQEFRDQISQRVAAKIIPESALQLLGDADTDWQDEIYRPAVGHDHNVTLAGGLGIIPYRLSLGYTNKNGLLRTDNFDRKTVGLNLTPGFFDNTLQVKIQGKAMLSKNHFADNGAIGSAISFDPTKKPYDENSKYDGYTTWTIPNGNPNGLAPRNPLALLYQRNDNSDVSQYIGNISTDYRLPFFTDLRANLNLGIDYSKGQGTIVIPNTSAIAFDDLLGGGLNNSYLNERQNTLLEFYLNYNKKVKKHGFDLMGGYSWQRFNQFNRDLRNNTAGTKRANLPDRDKELFLISLFTRLNYSYGDKFLFTFSLRNDHTSRFGPKARSGYFPAAAIAYKLRENDEKYLNSVKLRLGVGVTGQERVNPIEDPYYAHLGTYLQSDSTAQYQLGEEFINTLRPESYNDLIKWEENTTYNVAADVSIIKNRLSSTLELYQRFATDALANVQVPALQGLSNFANINLGSMESKGIELSINATPYLTDNAEWNIAFNGGYNIGKVTDFPRDRFVGGIAGGVGSNIQILSSGIQPYSFYVFKQLYDESGNILEGKFEDLNGDGNITEADKYIYKARAPLFNFGITNNIRIKNFDLSFAGRAYLGNYVYNNIQTDGGFLERLYQTSGYLSNVPSSAVNLNVEKQSSLTFSDHFVKNASFFRLDHITAGYNFNNLIGKSLRVYATIQNPFVITKYDGLDPEEFDGIDNNTYPRPRTYVLGVSVNF